MKDLSIIVMNQNMLVYYGELALRVNKYHAAGRVGSHGAASLA